VRILRCESESMSSYSMPPDLKFEDIINGILAFSKPLRQHLRVDRQVLIPGSRLL
jgi:hypothetical protein